MRHDDHAKGGFKATEANVHTEAVCATEELRRFGSLQGIGLVLIADAPTGTITYWSSTLTERLAGQVPEPLLADPGESHASDWLGTGWQSALLATANDREVHSLSLPSDAVLNPDHWECATHRIDELVVLEFLPVGRRAGEQNVLALDSVLHELRVASNVTDIANAAVQALQRFSRYQRVMCYRFLPDWSGEVIAEITDGTLPAQFEGQRFPASDIPKQARDLYADSFVRLITDIDRPESFLLHHENTPDAGQLDIARFLTRGVSEAHIAYMQGMAVRGSMSFAITIEDKLWGLIACHQVDPDALSASYLETTLSAARVITDLIESRLTAIMERQRRQQAQATYEEISSTFELADSDSDPNRGIRTAITALRDMLGYDVIIVHSDRLSCVIDHHGNLTVDHPLGLASADMFDLNFTRSGDYFWQTRCLNCETGTAQIRASMPGLAGLMLHQTPNVGVSVIGFGLREQTTAVKWAGRPGEVRVKRESDRLVVRPRESFEQWLSQETDHSRFWYDADRDALQALTRAVDQSLKNQVPSMLRR